MRHCQYGDNIGVWVEGDGATFDGIRFNPQDADPTPTPCQPTNGFHYEDIRVQSAQNVTVENCRFVDGSGVPGNGAGSGHIFITSASLSSTAASGFKLLNTILEPVHGSHTIQIHTNVTSYNAWWRVLPCDRR